MTAWVRDFERGIDYLEHLDGVAWNDAPLPGWFHRCKAQTRGFFGLSYVERCACGASKILGGWIDKNQTRRQRRGKR